MNPAYSASDCSFNAQWVEGVFNASLGARYNTRLCGGAREPNYFPASANRSAGIYYRLDYLRSALHEVAHWCVAGAYRRQLPDYGYWYAPDGRDRIGQSAFFAVEAKPQALELVFCETMGIPFSVSVDNPGAQLEEEVVSQFQSRVERQVGLLREQGLPYRAELFRQRLTDAS